MGSAENTQYGAVTKAVELMLAAGADPGRCLRDAASGEDRDAFVEATGGAMFPVARASRSGSDAVPDRSRTQRG